MREIGRERDEREITQRERERLRERDTHTEKLTLQNHVFPFVFVQYL